MRRVQLEIILGIIIALVTSALILLYGFGEEERMAEYKQASQARSIEQGAKLFEDQCSRCHGTQGLGIPGLCPPLNDRYFFDQRLKDVGWSGTQEDYIVATISSGRLVSTRPELFPGQGTPAMPSFSDKYGGPLREDQIRNLAAFVMNWSESATLVAVPTPPSGPVVGTDISKSLPSGDPASGEKLAASLACTACHIAAPTGPAWLPTADQPGIGTRAASRITQPDYTGKAKTTEQYLFESITTPGAFVVSGFSDGVMPGNYSNQLTDQNMADLIAYLLTLK